MTKEEFYHTDAKSGESTSSLMEEYIKDNASKIEAAKHDIARTLEGIDTIVENHYITDKDLQTVEEVLHKVEDRLIVIEAESDPNRMDSLRDLDPAYAVEIGEKMFKDDYGDIFSDDDLELIKQLIDDDAAYLDLLLNKIGSPKDSIRKKEDDYNEKTNYGCF